MKTNKFLASLLSAGLFSNAAIGAEAPVFLEFVRPLGMGGAFTAVADDHNVFGYNPAGMVQRTGAEVTILEIAGGGTTDLKEGYDFISDNEDELNDYDGTNAAFTNEILDKMVGLRPRAMVAADLASFVSGPRFFGLPIHGGFGAFGAVDFGFRFDYGAVSPTISYAVNNDVILPLSLAKRFNAPFLPGTLGVGFTGKFISRRQIRQDRIPLISIDDIQDPPMSDGRGIGSDLGLLYQPNERWNVGVMVRDFLGTKMSFDRVDAENGFQGTPERDTVIRPRTNVGVAVTPKTFFGLGHTSDRLVLAADIRDLFADDEHLFFQRGLRRPFGEDLWEHVHLGAEYRYWFLRLRGGAYQGYPSFGLGVDIPVLKIDYAFYSRELGARAGDEREENHIVSLALRFGTGNTEARERISKFKESRREGGSVPEAAEAAAEETPPSDPVPTAEMAEDDQKPAGDKKPAAEKKPAPAKGPKRNTIGK